MTDLNQQQQSLIASFVARMPDNQALSLDPADATARSIIDFFLDMSNKGSDRFPGLHDGITRAAAVGNTALPDRPTIVDIGKDRGGNATTRTWIGSSGLPFISGAATLLLDAESRAPLAFGAATKVGEGLVQVATNSAEAKPATRRMTAVTFFHAQTSPDELPRFGAIARTLNAQDGLQVTVTDPVIKVVGHTSVVIGLNRPQGFNPDCDYVFLEDAPISNPPLLVPFTGSATLPYQISGIGGDGRIGGLAANSLIYVQLSAGMQSLPVLPDSLPLGVTANASNPNVLNWSFPYTDPQEPIFYTASQAALDTQSAFLFQFSVPVSDPSSPYVFTICSKDTPEQPSVQCYQISDLQFTWHCVSEGTLVTLADGSRIDIGKTTNAMRLRTGIGDGTLAVEANWNAVHSGQGGNVIRLTTSGGHSLLLTAYHPVMTPAGLVIAADLHAGDHVIVEGGISEPLSRVELLEDHTGIFWNVNLGNVDDRRAGIASAAATFIANGIVVGDFAALGNQYRSTRRNFDYMQARLPKLYHKDYESALMDISNT
jgi:hypothetical protein